jgi:hypothetical protein
MHRDGIGCWFQYDDDEKPCMVFYHMLSARRAVNGGTTPPVAVAYLDELYKYDDDGYLWRVTKEWTALFRGTYNRFEHNNLFFFVNDCLSYLLHMKPFPEMLREAMPALDIVQTDDKRFRIAIQGSH